MPQPTAQWNPARDVWETDQVSICGHSDVFSETWPRSGSMRSGLLYVRPTWEHHTDASGCSSSPGPLLPTVVADNSRGLPSSGTDFQSLPNVVCGL